MKLACTLFTKTGADGVARVLAISPDDNYYFVPADNFNPELAEMVQSIEATGGMECLGAVLTSEK